MNTDKAYIGDGVYVESDGFGLIVTTSDGIKDTNTIYLEPEVWYALTKYVAQLSNRTLETQG
jgi:hypothetical protein